MLCGVADEKDGYFVGVDRSPPHGLAEDISQRRVAREQETTGFSLRQQPLPAVLKTDQLQIRLQELGSVKVMPIIQNDFGFRIERIDQKSAPIIRAENWTFHLLRAKERGGLHGHPILIEVGIDQLVGTNTPSVHDDCKRSHCR